MPIDRLTLMEIFAAIFSDHAAEPPRNLIGNQDHLSQSTCFETPSQELGAELLSLAQMMGDAPSLLQALIRSMQESGDERAACTASRIEAILEALRDDLVEEDTHVRTLLDYVYPVV